MEQLRQEKQEIDQQLRAIQGLTLTQSFPMSRRQDRGYSSDMDSIRSNRGGSRGRGRGGSGRGSNRFHPGNNLRHNSNNINGGEPYDNTIENNLDLQHHHTQPSKPKYTRGRGGGTGRPSRGSGDGNRSSSSCNVPGNDRRSSRAPLTTSPKQ